MTISMLLWTPSMPASDSSIIDSSVWRAYLESDRYKESMERGTCLCTLTHRSRSLQAAPDRFGKLSGITGKDDAQLICTEDCPSPIMKITRIFLEGDGVYATAEVFDESMFDPYMANQIKRFKGLVRNNIQIGLSCVIVAYWESEGGGSGRERAKSLNLVKGVDVTCNPSCKDSRVLGIIEDESYENTFSEKESNTLKSGGVLCKTFSDTTAFPEIKDLPKSSKIGLRVCPLKVKQFSQISSVEVLQESDAPKSTQQEPQQKEFSVSTVKERLRYAKLSPRMQFRRLILDYKGAIKSSGGVDKMKPEEVRVLKSLFVNDILLIIKQIHEDIMKGKQISTLIGASSISKSCREACAKLQIPYKQSMLQQQKTGYVSKDRMAKIQSAYIDFTNSIVDEVFNPNFKIKEETPEESEEGLGENEEA